MWTLGAPIEDAVCAMQLMRDRQTIAGIRNSKVILPHLGGFLAVSALPERQPRPPQFARTKMHRARADAQEFWYDTASGQTGGVAHRGGMLQRRQAALRFGLPPYWDRDYDVTWQFLEQAGLDCGRTRGRPLGKRAGALRRKAGADRSSAKRPGSLKFVDLRRFVV